jgi:hypothetical protein
MRLLKLVPLNKDRVELDIVKAIKVDSDSEVDITKVLNKITVIQCRNKKTLEAMEEVISKEANVSDGIVIFNSYEEDKDQIKFFFLEDVSSKDKFAEDDIIII